LLGLLEEAGIDLRMPHVRSMGDGLFELRPNGAEGQGRVFYCAVNGRRIVLLHSFIKKTQRTPLKDLRLARHRMKEIYRNG
jgi:phage-related protein